MQKAKLARLPEALGRVTGRIGDFVQLAFLKQMAGFGFIEQGLARRFDIFLFDLFQIHQHGADFGLGLKMCDQFLIDHTGHLAACHALIFHHGAAQIFAHPVIQGPAVMFEFGQHFLGAADERVVSLGFDIPQGRQIADAPGGLG